MTSSSAAGSGRGQANEASEASEANEDGHREDGTVMRGVSRQSFAELRDQLPEALAQGRPAAQRPRAGTRAAAGAATSAETVGDQLFSVLHLLDTEHGLRRALADPSRPADEKGSIVVALLHGKISEPAEELVTAAARARWARTADMTDALQP